MNIYALTCLHCAAETAVAFSANKQETAVKVEYECFFLCFCDTYVMTQVYIFILTQVSLFMSL